MEQEFVKVARGDRAAIAKVLEEAGFVYSQIKRVEKGRYGEIIKRIDGDFTVSYNADRNQIIVFGWHKGGGYKPADFLLEPLKKFGAIAEEFPTKNKPQIYVVINCEKEKQNG
jgi:hypothetical protein